jgi:hypothetical protein
MRSINLHIVVQAAVTLCVYKECFGNNLILKNVLWLLSAISLLAVVTTATQTELTKVFGQLSSLLKPYLSLSIAIGAIVGQTGMWYYSDDVNKVYSTLVLSCVTLSLLSHMFYCLLTSQWWNNQLISQSESYTKLNDVSQIIHDREDQL